MDAQTAQLLRRTRSESSYRTLMEKKLLRSKSDTRIQLLEKESRLEILSNDDVLTFEQRVANLRHILTLRKQRKIAEKTMCVLCTFTQLLSSPTKKEIDKLAALLNTLHDHDRDSYPVGKLSNVLRPMAVHTRAVKDLISANLDYIFELRKKQKIIEDAFRGLIVLVQASIFVTKAEIDEFGQTMNNLSIVGSVIYPFYPPFPYNQQQRTLYQHLWITEADEEWGCRDTKTFGLVCNKIQAGEIRSVAEVDAVILDLHGPKDTKDINTRAATERRHANHFNGSKPYTRAELDAAMLDLQGPKDTKDMNTRAEGYEEYEKQRTLYQHLWHTEATEEWDWDTKTFGLVCNKIQAGEISSASDVDAAILDLRGPKFTEDMNTPAEGYEYEGYELQRMLYYRLWKTEILYQHLSDSESSEERGCWDTKTFGLVCNKIQTGEFRSVAEVDAALLDLRGPKDTKDIDTRAATERRHANRFNVRKLCTRAELDAVMLALQGPKDMDTCAEGYGEYEMQRTLYQYLWFTEASEQWDWDTKTFGLVCNKIQAGEISSVSDVDAAILDLRGPKDMEDMNTPAEGCKRYEGYEYEGYEQHRFLYEHLWNTEILYQHLSDSESSEERGCWDTKTFNTFGLVCNKIQTGEIRSLAEVDAALLDLRGPKDTKEMRHANHLYARELYTRGKIDVDTCCYLCVFAKCSNIATMDDIDKYAEIMNGAPIHHRRSYPFDPPFPCNKEQRFLYCYLSLAVDCAEEEVDHQTFVRLCDMIQSEEITSMAEIDDEISK